MDSSRTSEPAGQQGRGRLAGIRHDAGRGPPPGLGGRGRLERDPSWPLSNLDDLDQRLSTGPRARRCSACADCCWSLARWWTMLGPGVDGYELASRREDEDGARADGLNRRPSPIYSRRRMLPTGEKKKKKKKKPLIHPACSPACLLVPSVHPPFACSPAVARCPPPCAHQWLFVRRCGVGPTPRSSPPLSSWRSGRTRPRRLHVCRWRGRSPDRRGSRRPHRPTTWRGPRGRLPGRRRPMARPPNGWWVRRYAGSAYI